MKPTLWNLIARVFFRFAPMGKLQKNEFSTQLDDLGQTGVLRCFENPIQNGGMKPTSWNSITRVFFRFAPMGKLDKTSFERNWTTFVNPAFCVAGKTHPKWWCETDLVEFDPKGVFSLRPDGETRKNAF